MSALLVALLPLLAKGIPEAVALIQSIRALHKQYPDIMTPDQIHAIVVAATADNEAGFDDFLARVAADQQAQTVVKP